MRKEELMNIMNFDNLDYSKISYSQYLEDLDLDMIEDNKSRIIIEEIDHGDYDSAIKLEGYIEVNIYFKSVRLLLLSIPIQERQKIYPCFDFKQCEFVLVVHDTDTKYLIYKQNSNNSNDHIVYENITYFYNYQVDINDKSSLHSYFISMDNLDT